MVICIIYFFIIVAMKTLHPAATRKEVTHQQQVDTIPRTRGKLKGNYMCMKELLAAEEKS